jgi:hypothetical protein
MTATKIPAAFTSEGRELVPEYAGPGIGISDACGLCGEVFDLMYPPDQYPRLANDLDMPEELICDACQDQMEADRDETAAA